MPKRGYIVIMSKAVIAYGAGGIWSVSADCLGHFFFPLQLYRGRVRDLLDMLRACVRTTPSLLGSTVWGMTDIHKVLSPLAPTQKDKPQPLYFVKVGF